MDDAALIERHESRRLKPYRDSVGKLTIAVGRNLDDDGLSDAEVSILFQNDRNMAYAALAALGLSSITMSATRQAALVDMAFNLGQTRLAGFHGMLGALRCNPIDWNAVADAAKNSLWFKETGIRGREDVALLRAGDWTGLDKAHLEETCDD